MTSISVTFNLILTKVNFFRINAYIHPLDSNNQQILQIFNIDDADKTKLILQTNFDIFS